MKVLPSFLIAFLFLLTHTLFAQPPNDNCLSALTLITSTTCTITNGSVAGATQSDTAITCGSYTSAAALDVWYKFAGLSGTTYDITVVPSSDFDAVLDLRSGTCSSQSVACMDNNWEGVAEILTYTVPVTGYYYVRLYPFMNSVTDTATTKTFTICITESAIGVEEIQGRNPFAVFPNPSAGKLSIRMDRILTSASMSIYNSLGLKVRTENISNQSTIATELNPGIYTVEIKDEEKVYLQKVIIQ